MSVTYGRPTYPIKGDENQWTRHDVVTRGGRILDVYVLAYGGRVDSYAYPRNVGPASSSHSSRRT